ncbi:hypothetical protein A4A49_01532 [Nicotiana attenuata]|uniref:Uncharacterized protein n=1 Tax=Nicotiana attenuata TaxID=49451 RepID=A0A314L5R0_NICAT|nr:hypothetical protein A4A49_01532 [Nicotiana attenuata]
MFDEIPTNGITIDINSDNTCNVDEVVIPDSPSERNRLEEFKPLKKKILPTFEPQMEATESQSANDDFDLQRIATDSFLSREVRSLETIAIGVTVAYSKDNSPMKLDLAVDADGLEENGVRKEEIEFSMQTFPLATYNGMGSQNQLQHVFKEMPIEEDRFVGKTSNTDGNNEESVLNRVEKNDEILVEADLSAVESKAVQKGATQHKKVEPVLILYDSQSTKNLILGGVGMKPIILCVNRNVVLWDLSSSFTSSKEEFEKPMAISYVQKLQELSNSALISTLTTSLTDAQLSILGHDKIKEWSSLVWLLKLACQYFEKLCPLFDTEILWKNSGAHFSQFCSGDQHFEQLLSGEELLAITTKVLLLVLRRNLITGAFSKIPFDPGVVNSSFSHITLEGKGGFIGRCNCQNHDVGVQSCCWGSFYMDDFKCGVKHDFLVYHFAHEHFYKRSWQENCKKNYRRYTSRIVDTSYGKGDSGNLNSPLSPLTGVILRVIQVVCSNLILSDHG